MFSVERLANSTLFIDGDKRIRISFPASKIARVTYTINRDYLDNQSLIVVTTCEASAFELVEHVAYYELQTDSLTVQVDKVTGRLAYHGANETVLQQEPERGGKWLIPKNIYRNIYSQDEEVAVGQSIDGVRAEAVVADRVFDRDAFEAKLEFIFTEDEALFGLGSHEEGFGNLRGKYRELYQQNMKACVPFFISTKNYGVLLDCLSAMTFHDDEYGSYLWADVVDELDYYFIVGTSADDVYRGYYTLTGAPPLPPKWAFGYIQSKERYVNDREAIDVAREYRRREIPLDAIVLDWNTWPAGQWGQKSLDPRRFSNPAAFIEELHALDVKLMVSIWPIFTGNSENKQEMLRYGLMLGNQSTYDAFNPAARRVYWEQAQRGLFSHGVDAWWCDCTEPFEADWRGALKPEPFRRMELNTRESKKYIDDGLINAYSLVHSQGVYEGQRAADSNKRVINLTRSSYAGQHRYATFTWNGDVSATWETLKRSIPEGVNFCASGEPYWTVDIGGFFISNQNWAWFWSGGYDAGCRGILPGNPVEPDPNDTGCTDLGYWELYTRWLQYGAFLPMMRSHGTDAPREVWRFGEVGDMFYDVIVKYIRLRYRLLPYIYSTAAAIAATGASLIRAVALAFPGDPTTHGLLDQYLFGPSLMVCPITSPMYYSRNSTPLADTVKKRPVYLPSGVDWYDFWTDQWYGGGQTIAADAPLTTTPLFVPAGSIIPLGAERQHASGAPDNWYVLRIYRGQDAHFQLYSDAGDSYAYERGEFCSISFDWRENSPSLTISARTGSFPNMPETMKMYIKLLSPTGTHERNVEYQGEAIVCEF